MQLVVGRIGRAHGIKGEVSVEVRTDEPELRLAPGAVLATDPATVGPLTIATGRVHSGRLVLRFEGVADRTAAEGLRGVLLIAEIDPQQTPEDPEEFYDHQLIDLDVVTADGRPIGRIAEITHLPYQDLLVVERPGGGEVLIPFVHEIVPEIDLEEQRAVVTPPPGLLDEAEALPDEAEALPDEAEALPDEAEVKIASTRGGDEAQDASTRGGDEAEGA